MKIHNFSLKDEQIEVAKFGLEHLVIIMLHLFFWLAVVKTQNGHGEL
jgi:hypothetical protein